jgi:hypothetical protein
MLSYGVVLLNHRQRLDKKPEDKSDEQVDGFLHRDQYSKLSVG